MRIKERSLLLLLLSRVFLENERIVFFKTASIVVLKILKVSLLKVCSVRRGAIES